MGIPWSELPGILNWRGFDFFSTGSYKSNVVIFTQSLSSAAAGSLDASATANIVSANFKAYNINIQNSYGSGAQAVALVANGDKQSYYGCGFYGYQDTLYVSKLFS